MSNTTITQRKNNTDQPKICEDEVAKRMIMKNDSFLAAGKS